MCSPAVHKHGQEIDSQPPTALFLDSSLSGQDSMFQLCISLDIRTDEQVTQMHDVPTLVPAKVRIVRHGGGEKKKGHSEFQKCLFCALECMYPCCKASGDVLIKHVEGVKLCYTVSYKLKGIC